MRNKRDGWGSFIDSSGQGSVFRLGYLVDIDHLICQVISRMRKNSFFTGCSKRSRYKAPEIPRKEAYIEVRRNDEG